MQEIWISLSLIVLFLFLYIIQPLVKKLKSINGLSWLPVLAFIIMLVLIPAYGFRPEAIPLFLYAAFLSFTGLLRQIKGNTSYRDFRRKNSIAICLHLVFLLTAGAFALYFSPRKDSTFDMRLVYSQKISGRDGTEKEYFIYFYTEENSLPSRPLLVLLPPITGSHTAVDMVARELKNRGFSVLTYSRRNFDSPVYFIKEDSSRTGRYGINPLEQLYRLHTLALGTVKAKANARGRVLEESRRDDAEFLLSWIRDNPRIGDKMLFDMVSRDAVFLAGYDAGGSALILLSDSFAGARTNYYDRLRPAAGRSNQMPIKGIIAIESSLWSMYREEAIESPALPSEAGWFQSVQHGMKTWLAEKRPKKIAPLAQIPALSTPVLFLVSDKARYQKYRDQSYGALYKVFEDARGTAVLASADGAGPFDYSDFPVKYPLITALNSGFGESSRKNLDAPAFTAELITWFAASILDSEERQLLTYNTLPEGTEIIQNNIRR